MRISKQGLDFNETRLFLQSGAADIAALLLGAMMAGAAVLVAMIFVM